MNALSHINSLSRPAIWKYMIAAIPSIFVSGIIFGALFGAFMATNINDWSGYVVYAAFTISYWGVIPAVSAGALWYAAFDRFEMIRLPIYLLTGPAIGLSIGAFDPALGVTIGALSFLFSAVMHLLIKAFPGLLQ